MCEVRRFGSWWRGLWPSRFEVLALREAGNEGLAAYEIEPLDVVEAVTDIIGCQCRSSSASSH